VAGEDGREELAESGRGVERGSMPFLTPVSPTTPPRRFWFRLYWFPLKVLYATCHCSLQSVPDIPYYFFFNILLLLLMVMNIYWFLVSRPLWVISRPGRGLCIGGAKGLWQPQGFIGALFLPQYIVAFAAKVLTGQMRELEDLREYDTLEAQTAKPCKAE
jgi:ceramide synthetase